MMVICYVCEHCADTCYLVSMGYSAVPERCMYIPAIDVPDKSDWHRLKMQEV